MNSNYTVKTILTFRLLILLSISCFQFFFIAKPCTGIGNYKDNLESDKKIYHPTRITKPPIIDGILDDKAWSMGNWTSEFTQFRPINGAPPAELTDFMILYDDDFLYIAIRAWDSAPDSIVSRLTRRDQTDGDQLSISFDSYFDRRTAFVFGLSSSGVKFDQIISNDGENTDHDWDPNWWGNTSITSEGWVAEMKIPFNQLRFDKSGEGFWGLQVIRIIHRHDEVSLWQHRPIDTPGQIRNYGKLIGLDNIKPRKILDVTPYFLASALRSPPIANDPFATGKQRVVKIGLDAKIGVRQNFTVDLAISPDFGQVEADPSEVNLSAYETFFPEKRPFFVEGRNISSFPIGFGGGAVGSDNLFYSRRIGKKPSGKIHTHPEAFADVPLYTHILGAAKITGKTKSGLSLALIEVMSAEEKAEISLNGNHFYETIEPLTNYFLGRIQKDLKNGATNIGGIFTGVHRRLDPNLKNQMHKKAYSGGIDLTNFFINSNNLLTVNIAFSHVGGEKESITLTQISPVRYFQRVDAEHISLKPDRSSLTGTGGKVQFGKLGSGHWNYIASFLWKSPQFEVNDLGYMRNADQIIKLLYVGYRQWEPKPLYLHYNINLSIYSSQSFGQETLTNGINLHGAIQFVNHWTINGSLEYNRNMLSTSLLRGGPSLQLPNSLSISFVIESDKRKQVETSLITIFRVGAMESQKFFRIAPNFKYKPINNMQLSINPSLIRMGNQLQYTKQLNHQGETRYILASIDQSVGSLSLRLDYSINPDLTIQFWGQPFIASVEFHDFKHITDPRAEKYTDRFYIYDAEQISLNNGVYVIDENKNGLWDYSFPNPSFSAREFLSNLVIRWEYNPGSTLYLVWNHGRRNFDQSGVFDLFNNMAEVFNDPGNNTFLIKLSYRIGLR